MGILGVIGAIVVVGSHYGFMSVATGWYYFWLVLLVIEALNVTVSYKK